MTHNIKSCIALFLEEEYEALTVEVYWESKVITTRVNNDMHPFTCIHCRETYLSKNMKSYHRMFNYYKVYKEIVVLKMYPTWENSNSGELHMITNKYGKIY
jgi:hypothetical protein